MMFQPHSLFIKLYAAICISLSPGLVLLLNENPHICNTNSPSGFLLLPPLVYMPDTDPPATHSHFIWHFKIHPVLRHIFHFLSHPKIIYRLLFSGRAVINK